MTLKMGACPVKAKGRLYSPNTYTWLVGCMAASVAMGTIARFRQADTASAAMAVPKPGKAGEYHLISDDSGES